MGAASDLNREGTAPLTSEERREARYQRRKAKREAKALETTGKTFDEVINFGNMVEAGRKCCDGSRWKTSTILFETHLLPECADIVETLAGEKRRFKGFHSFTTVEHGKVTMKLSRQSIKAIRRKMDIFRAWVTEGQMDAEDAIQSYQSWRAHAKRCDSYRTLEAMDVRFTSMFAPELRRRKNKFPCTLRAKKTKAGWEYTRITQQATQAA